MEQSSSNISFILFEEFLELLQYHGFTLGVDTHLQLAHLLQGLEGKVTVDRLKTLLAPIFAQNEQQQKEFYQLFDQYFSQYQASPQLLTQAPKPPINRKESSPKISNWLRILSRRRFYLLLQLLILGGLGFLGIELINCYKKTRSLERTFLCMQGISFPEPIAETPESGLPSRDTSFIPLNNPASGDLPTDWDHLTDNLDLQNSPPLEENISDLEASWYEQYNPVIKILLVLLILGGWLFYEMYRYNRKKLFLLRERNKPPPYIWTVHPEQLGGNLHTEEEFYLASRRLREREAVEGEELDLEKSVEQTVSKGGYPNISFKKRTKPPEYLVLIQKNHKKDHLAMFYQQMIFELSQQDIYTECYFYEQDPRLVWKEKYHETLYLEDLFRRFPDDRLIVIGDANHFFDPIQDDLCTWTTALHKWKQVAIVSPISPLEWGHREVRLSKEFTFLPATTQALAVVVDLLNQDIQPPLRHWLESNEYPISPPADAPDLIARLQEYFDTHYESGQRMYKKGNGRLLFTWLCAIALYPELSWDLTLSMGRILEQSYGEGLTTPPNLLKLVRLPWFRDGDIPDDVRELLIPNLNKKDAALVRTVLVDMLKNNPPPSGSYAEAEHELLLAVQEAQLYEDLTHKVQVVRQAQEYSMNHEIRDFTVVRYLKSVPASILKVKLPTSVSKWLFRQGISSLGLKGGVRGAIVCIMAISILMRLNDSWMKIENYQGEHYYLANDEARMRFHTYVGNQQLAKQEYPQAARSYEEALLVRESSGLAEYLTPEYNLALLKLGLGKEEEAKAEFASISEQSEALITVDSLPDVKKEQLAHIKTESAYNQGVIAFRSQNLEEAEEAFQRAATMDDSHSDAVYGQAMVLLRKALTSEGANQTNKLVLALNRLQDVQELDSSYLKSHPELGIVLDSLSMGAFPTQVNNRLEDLRLTLGLIEQLSSDSTQAGSGVNTELELDPQLEYMSDFRQGLAVVRYEGNYGFVDEKRNLLGIKYEDAKPFADGLAAVKRDKLWGFVDLNMREVIQPQYENADEFVEGWASVKKQGRWGMIDQANRQQVPFVYEQPIRFESSTTVPSGARRLAVVVQQGKYFYIDRQGQDVFGPDRFKWAENFSPSAPRFARVNRWGANYYINRQGNCEQEFLKDRPCPTEKWERILVRDLRPHIGQINALGLAADNQTVITGGADGQAVVMKKLGREQGPILRHSLPVRAVAISSNPRQYLTGGDDRQLRLWGEDGELLQTFPATGRRIWTVAFSPDKQLAAAGSEDEGAYIYLLRTGELLTRLVGHTQDVSCLAFAPDGSRIATGSEDGTIRIWNLEGKEVRKINTRNKILSLAYAPDGTQIVIGTKSGLVLVYDLSRSVNLPSLSLDQHKDWVWQVAFSPNAEYILSCSADNTAKVYNPKRQIVMNIRRPGTVRAATFSRDGKFVLIASWGGTGTANNKVSVYKVEQY
ncbi:MAG: WG repeat-containing protein [Bacteroidota bacterium]